MNTPTGLRTSAVQRPFANAHWSLPVALIVAWCFVLLGAQCRTSPRYPEVALSTLTVCIALWASHIASRANRGWGMLWMILLRAGIDLSLLLLLIIGCSIPLVMLMPTYECRSPKSRTAVLILSASSAREQIAERAARSHTLQGVGTGVSVATGEGAKAATVTDDGLIVLAGDDPAAVVIFRPILTNGVVSWTCQGLPADLMPSSCR